VAGSALSKLIFLTKRNGMRELLLVPAVVSPAAKLDFR
jgi:hypothetical protein